MSHHLYCQPNQDTAEGRASLRFLGLSVGCSNLPILQPSWDAGSARFLAGPSHSLGPYPYAQPAVLAKAAT